MSAIRPQNSVFDAILIAQAGGKFDSRQDRELIKKISDNTVLRERLELAEKVSGRNLSILAAMRKQATQDPETVRRFEDQKIAEHKQKIEHEKARMAGRL